MPDVKFTKGETARSFKESVVPAMEKLVEIGIANGNFGVTGGSFGGFATNIIITQTQKFKAAISLVGISDWVSRRGMPGVFWRRGDEIGQARLGGTLWDIPEIYIKNSPVFHIHKVETPLMIIHGTDDRCVRFSQSEEMYYAMRDLNKTAILIAYPGETHLGADAEIWVIKDIWGRILSWFDKFLK
jgi:dipeptidyl aminopeptidase/acylaminoacyl peptidase